MAKNYDEDDDYYDQQADKDDFHRHGKPRRKESGSPEGRRKHRRGDVQDFMDEIDRQQEEESAPQHYSPSSDEPSPVRYGSSNPPSAVVPQHHEHRFGPNTLQFNGIKIDFDGVKEVISIQSYHNGYQTYGLKFTFVGDKGFYKIVWYETNKTGRDTDCASAIDEMRKLGKQ